MDISLNLIMQQPNNEIQQNTTKNITNNITTIQTRSNKRLNDCNICYNKIDVQGKIDSCSHLFCYSCIKKWSKVK